MRILNDLMISNSPSDFVEKNFQSLSDFLLEKFYIYDANFDDILGAFLYNNAEKITKTLKNNSIKQRQILELFAKLAYRYNEIFSFAEFCESLDLSQNLLLSVLNKLSKVRDLNATYNAFNTALCEIEKIYNNENEQNDQVFANFIVVNFIYTALYSRRDNHKIFKEILEKFSYVCTQKSTFLNKELLDNIFNFDSSNTSEFLDNFLKQINGYLDPHCDINIKVECESSNYANFVSELKSISFDNVLKYAHEYYTKNITDENTRYYNLNRGKTVIDNKPDLFQYIHSFGRMHKEKLLSSFGNAKKDLLSYNKIRLIDYGCGQGMGVMNFLDFISSMKPVKIEEIILIEPSRVALSRAILHSKLFSVNTKITAICKYLNDLNLKDLARDNIPTVQIFSNILDMSEVRLSSSLYSTIASSFGAKNLFFCVSPYGIANDRLDLFYEYFKDNFNARQISNEALINKPTKYEQIFEVLK